MDELSVGVLVGALIILIIISGFFSGSETGLMTLNRYRLRHLAKAGHRGALRASALLKRPDRLIGLILLGNNFVNILASTLATLLALQLMGDIGLAVAPIVLTLVILIFAEVAPKTLAALHPERFAFPASFVLGPLLRVFYYPLVLPVTVVSNGLLRLLKVSPEEADAHSLSSEELRTVVNEAGAMIPMRHQKMLLNILDLERVTVDDIMVPRGEIVGIDLDDDWEETLEQLRHSQHTRLPVFRGGIDNVLGLVHLRNTLHLVEDPEFDAEMFMEVVRQPYFVPEGTTLTNQLLHFQRHRRRIGLVVDEYGDIQGLVTLEDILEEIVGEFTTDPGTRYRDIHLQEDGTYLIDGGANLRELNRTLEWELPTEGPKTLNGLILEHLEAIPEPGTSLLIAGYPVEIMQVKDNAVKIARVYPAMKRGQPGE